MKEVEVVIAPDGSGVEIDAIGFKGGECKDFIKKTLDLLGNDVLKEKKKPEYYETVTDGVKIGV